MNAESPNSPFSVLGVPREASEEEIRARYLELVKKFPPDRDPDKFREIRSAYEAAKDPLTIAGRLIQPPDEDPPSWESVIEAHKEHPPKLTPAFLISLGNRDSQNAPAASDASTSSGKPKPK